MYIAGAHCMFQCFSGFHVNFYIKAEFSQKLIGVFLSPEIDSHLIVDPCICPCVMVLYYIPVHACRCTS